MSVSEVDRITLDRIGELTALDPALHTTIVPEVTVQQVIDAMKNTSSVNSNVEV